MAKYNINLGFEIDTNKMEKAIRDISTRIEELTKKGTINNLVIPEAEKNRYLAEMIKLRDAVAKTFTERKFGTDPTLKMGAAAPEIEAAARALNNVNTAQDRNIIMAQRVVSEQTKVGKSMREVSQEATGFDKALNKITGSFQAIAMFSIAQFGFRGLTGTITDAIEHVKSLDKAMTGIRVVTNASTAELKQWAVEYNTMAQEMGKTTRDVAEAFETFYRQGREGAEATKMVKATITGAAVSGEGLVEVGDKLTAMINGFQLAGDEAMSVIDKFAILDANMATSFKEMSYAMTKIAASAKNANMSLGETLSMVATISEVTREAPENIGTALKTIVARMRGITTEGFITDESIQDLNKVDRALRMVGISQRDAAGEMRNTYEVFDELGKKWNTLSSQTQAYVATAVAGSRQTTRFYAMIENWDKVMEAHDLTLNSSGAATRQFEEVQHGLEFQMNQTRASVEEVYAALVSTSSIASANAAFQGLVKTISGLLSVVHPSTIGLLGLNRIVEKLARQKLTNLDFSKIGFKNSPFQHLTNELEQSQKNLNKAAADVGQPRVDPNRIKEMNKDLSTLKLSQREYNLLTKEQKAIYDGILDNMQRIKTEMKANFNAEEDALRIKKEGWTTAEEEESARLRLLNIAEQLGVPEVQRVGNNDQILAAIRAQAEANRQNLTIEQQRLATENQSVVLNMKKQALVKTMVSETAALVSTLMMANMTYASARDAATNRFELASAKAQYDLQRNTALLTSFSRTASQGLPMYLQQQQIAASIAGQTQKAAAFGKAAGAATIIAPVVELGVQAFSTIANTAEQRRINQEKKEYDELIKTLEDYTNKITKIKELQKDLTGMAEAFDSLAKGIGTQGENLNLTNEQYAQYNNYVSQLTEAMPELIQYYNKEGRAVLNNKNTMADYLKLLKEKERTEAEALIQGGTVPGYISEKSKDIVYESYLSSSAMYARGLEYKGGVKDVGGGIMTGAAAGLTTAAAAGLTLSGIAASTGVGIPVALVTGILSGIAAIAGFIVGSWGDKVSEKDIDKNSEEYKKMQGVLKKIEDSQKRSIQQTLDQVYGIAKLSSDAFDALDENLQKNVDLAMQRLDLSVLAADRRTELEQGQYKEDLEKALKSGDEQKIQKVREQIENDVLLGLDMLQDEILEIFSQVDNAVTIQAAFKKTSIDTESLEEERISMQAFVEDYTQTKQEIVDMISSTGKISADEAAKLVENMDWSAYGEQVLKLQERLKGLGVDISNLGPVSIQSAKGIESLITGYAKLDDSMKKAGTTEEYGKKLEGVLSANSDLINQLGIINKLQQEGNWLETSREIEQFKDILRRTVTDTDLLTSALEAVNDMFITTSVNVEATKQRFNSLINAMKSQLDTFDDLYSVLNKVDDKGLFQLGDMLDFAGKHPEVIKFIEKDVDGLLRITAQGYNKVLTQGFDDLMKTLDENQQHISTEIIKMNDMIAIKNSKSLTSGAVNTIKELEDALKAEGIALEGNIRAYDDLNDILGFSDLDDRKRAIEDLNEEIKLNNESLSNWIKLVELGGADTYFAPKVREITDALEDMTFEAKENAWALEDLQRSFDELPLTLEKANYAFEKAGRTWAKAQRTYAKAPEILEKAYRQYNKTIKKLAEDEAVVELKFVYDIKNLDITSITNKIDTIKLAIEFMDIEDPTEAMSLYGEIISETTNRAELLNQEVARLMTLQANSAGEAKELANQITNVSKAITDNYKEGLSAQKQIRELQKKQDEEQKTEQQKVLQQRQAMYQQDADNVSRLFKTTSEAISRLQTGGFGRAGGLISYSIFDRPEEIKRKDPVLAKKQENAALLQEHQAYLNKVNELNRKALELSYEASKSDIAESRLSAEETLQNAIEARQEAEYTYRDAQYSFEEAQRNHTKAIEDYNRSLERIPYEIAKLEKAQDSLYAKMEHYNTMLEETKIAWAKAERGPLVLTEDDQTRLNEYLDVLKNTGSEIMTEQGDKRQEILDTWIEEADQSLIVRDHLEEILSMTNEEWDLFLSKEGAIEAVDTLFAGLLAISADDLEDPALHAVREVNEALVKAMKDNDYDTYKGVVEYHLEQGTLPQDVAKMHQDLTDKSTKFLDERTKARDAFFDETIKETGLTRDELTKIIESVPDFEMGLELPDDVEIQKVQTVVDKINKILADNPLKISTVWDDSGFDVPGFGFAKGTDKLEQYKSGTQQGTKTEGWKLTGELGREFAILPNGKTKMLGQRGPEMSYLPKGTVIYNHNDTEKIMNYMDDPSSQNTQNYMELDSYAQGTTIFHPLAGQGSITSSFSGARKNPVTGKVQAHNGIDLAAPSGTPIYAVDKGSVASAGSAGTAGIMVVLNHNNGFKTKYMHMSKLNTSQGAQVKPGAIIGYVGSTGQSTGPHLHFEILQNGVARNPASYLDNSIKSLTQLSTLSDSSQATQIGTPSYSGNAGKIYSMLRAAGFNHAGATAALGNIQGESNFNPLVVGDNGTSFGLIQWHKDRATAMKNWAASKKMNWQTVEAQIGYFLHELGSGYPSLLSELRNNDNSAASMSRLVRRLVYEYERPADPAGGTKTRTGYAMKFFNNETTGSGSYGSYGVSNLAQAKSTISDLMSELMGGIAGMFSIKQSNTYQGLQSLAGSSGKAPTTLNRSTTQNQRASKFVTQANKLLGSSSISSGNIPTYDTADIGQVYASNDLTAIYRKMTTGNDPLLAKWSNGTWNFIEEVNRDIPAFSLGTTGTPREEPALVGENGFEMAILPNGRTKILGKNGPEVVNLPKGTVIYNHESSKMVQNYVPDIDSKTIASYAGGTETPTTQETYQEKVTYLLKQIFKVRPIFDDATWTKFVTSVDDGIYKVGKIQSLLEQVLYIVSNQAMLDELIKIKETQDDGNKTLLNMLNIDTSSPEALTSSIKTAIQSLQEKYLTSLKSIVDTMGIGTTDTTTDRTTETPTVDTNITGFTDAIDGITGANSNLIEKTNEVSDTLNNLSDDVVNLSNRISNIIFDLNQAKEDLAKARQDKENLELREKWYFFLQQEMNKEDPGQWEMMVEMTKTVHEMIEWLVQRYAPEATEDEKETLREDFRRFAMGQNTELANQLGETFLSMVRAFWPDDIEGVEAWQALSKKYMDKFGVAMVDITTAAITSAKETENRVRKTFDSRFNKAVKDFNDALIKIISDRREKMEKTFQAAKDSGRDVSQIQSDMIAEMRKQIMSDSMFLREWDIAHSQMRIDQAEVDIKKSQATLDELALLAEKQGGLTSEQLALWDQVMGRIQSLETDIESAKQRIADAEAAKFQELYEYTFRDFDEAMTRINKAFDNQKRMNDAMKLTANRLFALQTTKDSLAHIVNIQLPAAEKELEMLNKILVEANLNVEQYEMIQQRIQAVEEQRNDLLVQQQELIRQQISDGWQVVEKVLDRIKERMDRMKFELDIKDTIADLELLRVELDAARGIIDMSALYLTPDLSKAYADIDMAIGLGLDAIEMNKQFAQTIDDISNAKLKMKDIDTSTIEGQKELQKLHEETADALQKQAFLHQKAAEAALAETKALKEQYNALKKDQVLSHKAYEELIKQKEEELDALEEEKKKRDEINQLMKARLELLKAMDDVSHAYITGAGIEIMQPDFAKVEEARSKVEELQAEEYDPIQDLIDALKDEIVALREEDQKKQEQFGLQLEALGAHIEMWQQIADKQQEQADYILSNWESIVYDISAKQLDDLEELWSRQLGLTEETFAEIANLLNVDWEATLTQPLSDTMSSIISDWGELFNTHLETSEEVFEQLRDIIDTDFNDAIGDFRNSITDWVDANRSLKDEWDALVKAATDRLNDVLYPKEVSKPEASPTSKAPTPTSPSVPPPTSGGSPNTPAPSQPSQPKSGDKVKLKSASTTWYYDSNGSRPIGTPKTAKGFGDDHEYTIYNTAYKNAYQINLDYLGWVKLTDLVGYKTGGLANYTGPAWLDGTPDDPELVLNAQDTSNILQAVNLLRNLELEKVLDGMTIEFDEQGIIKNALREIADILMNQDRDSKIYIDNVNLPNVQSPTDFINDLGQFVNFGRNQIL